MSVEQPKNKVLLRVLLVVVPIIVLGTGYMILFGKKKDVNQDASQSGTSAVNYEEPKASEKDKELSKIDVYEESVRNKQSDEHIRKQSNIDALFNDEPKTNPSPDKSAALDNWSDKKAEPVPVETKPKKTGGAKKQQTVHTNQNNGSSGQKQVDQTRRTGFYSSHKATTEGGSNEGNSQGNHSNNYPDSQEDLYSTPEVSCVINMETVCKSGQTLRMRAQEEFVVNGVTIPKYTVISGLVSIGNERANVTIVAIKLKDQTIRCKYMVYDMDGVQGVYAPANVNQQIAKNGVGQGLSLSTRIPVIGGTISSGSQQKVQDPTVTFPVGYKLMIHKIINQ